MDSAIPSHLRCPRTRNKRVGDDYVPPFPSTSVVFGPEVKQLVIAYFGMQHLRHAEPGAAGAALQWIRSAFDAGDGPAHWDRASYVDEAGYRNVLSIGYWNDAQKFDRWFAAKGAAWTEGGLGAEGLGTFVEILRPGIERFETLFSSNTPEGAAVLSGRFSGDIQEHGYWGGARDRIPLSQADAMSAVGEPRVIADGARHRVVPHENICLIRSGQDWSRTVGEERRMFLEDIEPVLRAGMDFLRDEGRRVGCFANRYMRLLDHEGREIEKSFGMSWWKGLDALERWAESHPTHVAIFAVAMKYLGNAGPDAQLRLYHEVAVAAADQQLYEYLNCHASTGMLRAATPGD